MKRTLLAVGMLLGSWSGAQVAMSQTDTDPAGLLKQRNELNASFKAKGVKEGKYHNPDVVLAVLPNVEVSVLIKVDTMTPQVIKKITTGKDGTVVLKGLEPGHYGFRFNKSSKDYSIISKVQTVRYSNESSKPVDVTVKTIILSGAEMLFVEAVDPHAAEKAALKNRASYDISPAEATRNARRMNASALKGAIAELEEDRKKADPSDYEKIDRVIKLYKRQLERPSR